MTKSINNKYPWLLTWGKWLVYILIFALFLIKSLHVIDPDFGWHLREGQDFLNGIFPARDIYNFNAADYSWAAHEWLSDVLMAFLFNMGGYLLVAIIWGLFFTAGFWFAGRNKFGPVVFAAFLAALPFMGVRTVVFAVFGLGFLIWFTEYKSIKPKLKLLLIPLILLLWAQLHGSFIVGIVYLLFRAIFIDKSWKMAVATIVGSLITIINPFGYHLWLETLAILFDREKTWNIGEWAIGIDFWTIMPLFMIWLTGFVLKPPKKISLKKANFRNWFYFIRFDILAFLASFKSIRNYPLFALAAISPAHDSMIELNKMARITRQGLIFGKIIYSLFIAGMMFVTINFFYPYVQNMFEYNEIVIATSERNNMPNKIINYLNENPCNGNLFNHYNLGGYLIWKLPNQKVYADGRMGSAWTRPNGSDIGEAGENYFLTWKLIYFGEAIERDLVDDLFGAKADDSKYEYTEYAQKRQMEIFEQFNITCAIIDKESNIYNQLKSQDWKTTIADDNGWFLLEKPI
jgi:hypothetical protein